MENSEELVDLNQYLITEDFSEKFNFGKLISNISKYIRMTINLLGAVLTIKSSVTMLIMVEPMFFIEAARHGDVTTGILFTLPIALSCFTAIIESILYVKNSGGGKRKRVRKIEVGFMLIYALANILCALIFFGYNNSINSDCIIFTLSGVWSVFLIREAG